MCDIFLYLVVYVVGFLATLVFLIFFGKKIGIDYDVPRNYTNYDDYSSNGEAYLAFSLVWFIFVPATLLIKSILRLIKLIDKVKR